MTQPRFLLTKKRPLTLLRYTADTYLNGELVRGEVTEVPIEVNIQPMRLEELQIMPEADRTREWYKLFSASEIRTLLEGDGGHAADEFMWQGGRYKVMKVKNYVMGVLDHYEAMAAKMGPTP